MPAETVYFAHISDTHIGPTRDLRRHGLASYPCALELVTRLNCLPTRPDFVMHTGDIVNHPDEAAFALAAELFARLEMPVYYVNGNHDTAAHIRRYLPMGPHQPLVEDPAALAYSFEVKGQRFMVLDGRGPDEIDPHGRLSAAQLAWAAREATPHGPPLTVFIHFPAWPLNAIWMDANMLLLNGPELHHALRPARGRLRGVFHGHVHQPMLTNRDGISYICAPSAFAQFTAWPEDAEVQLDPDHPPGYSFVHLTPQQTLVHFHTFPRPG